MSKQRFFRLPKRIGTTSVLMLSILLLGIGLSASYKTWITGRLRQSTAVSAAIIRPANDQIYYLRSQNNIVVFSGKAQKNQLAKGSVALPLYHITTTKPVIFVTIDDGVFKPKDAAEYMIGQNLPITAFLTINAIQSDFDYFGQLNGGGTTIENHTLSHPSLPKLKLADQKTEICNTSKILKHVYGKAPSLLRPPYGDFNADTERAAASCGIRGLALWDVVVVDGKIQYQKPYTKLRPGDIVLLHFRPNLKSNLVLLMKTAHQEGLQIGRLEDWIK